MRIEKFIADCECISRKDAIKALSKGLVTLNGRTVKNRGEEADPEKDVVTLSGRVLSYSRFTYIMVNKPEGYVSATEDKSDKTVLDLLPPEMAKKELFPAGRLDKNTTGLVLMTNDGVLSHFLLAPASHVFKRYSFTVKFPLSNEDINALEKGVDIGGYVTKPCKVELEDEKKGIITICEGKYHQIKLMMQSVHNQITSLKRESFGSLVLDSSLSLGEWRYLSEQEISNLKADVGNKS